MLQNYKTIVLIRRKLLKPIFYTLGWFYPCLFIIVNNRLGLISSELKWHFILGTCEVLTTEVALHLNTLILFWPIFGQRKTSLVVFLWKMRTSSFVFLITMIFLIAYMRHFLLVNICEVSATEGALPYNEYMWSVCYWSGTSL